MTIGFSDGSQQDSWSDYFLGSYHKDLASPTEQEPEIDRDHHVPLVASALMDKDGKMYGMAVDHRIKPNPEYDQFLMLHEASELPHMRNLVDAGMNPTEAYHEAHDKIATPTETAAVRAHAVRSGQDPDEYLDRYKEYWREAAKIASEPSDRQRHPDAHTTRYKLDEGEGAYRIAMAGEGDEPTLLTGQPAEPSTGTPEGDLHRKQEELPFAMTRMLGGSRGTPVMPAANENIPVTTRMWSDFSKGDKGMSSLSKPELKKLEQEISQPSRYDKAVQQSQDVKSRRESFKIVPPEGIQTTTIDQLRDWFKPK